ncbi:MAG: oligopeptidase A, partial [Paraglaciecola sp.]|nr:oligopeptidase A [Paraglaciecola sp.]
MTEQTRNPLQDLSGLPRFSEIKPEHIQPAIMQGIENCKAKINELLTQTTFTWDNLVAPLEEVDDQLSLMWSPVSHMNSVVSNDDLREAHDGCLPALSEFSTWVGQNTDLYNAYVQIQQSAEFDQLSQAQQKVIEHAIRDFKLSGVALDGQKKQRYAEIQSRLSDLGSTFSNNV